MIFWTKFAQKGCYQSKIEKSEQRYWILYIRNSSGSKFQLKLTILIFWTKFVQKERFQYKTNKMNTTIEFCAFDRVSLGTKFQFKLKILIFWTKFAQKAEFQSKTEKVNITIEFCILELVYVPNFSLNWHWFFFYQICPKREFPVENGKIALVRASIVVTYHIRLFRTWAGRHNGILILLLLLVAETKTFTIIKTTKKIK